MAVAGECQSTHSGCVAAAARRLKESTLTRSRSIRPAAPSSYSSSLQLLKHPSLGPLILPPPAGGGRAAAQLLGRQQNLWRGGAGHENERGHAVAVRDPTRDPAARPRRWGWQPRLDALPQLLRQESIHETGHNPEHPKRQSKSLKPPTGGSGMSCKWDLVPAANRHLLGRSAPAARVRLRDPTGAASPAGHVDARTAW
jgi:hypothetical protein